NDGKASLFSFNIPVHDLSRLIVIAYLKLLLMSRQGAGFFLGYRHKRLLSKGFNAGRSPKAIGQFFYLLIRHLKDPQLSLDKLMVQIESCVIFMVIIKLTVRYGSVIPLSVALFFIHTMDSASVDYRSQSHLPELFNGRFYHSLKSQLETDIDSLFL